MAIRDRYGWGYALTTIYAAIGVVVIILSVIGGIIFISSAPAGMGYLGFIIVFAGLLQGVMMLGFGAIGTAILEGSEAQQDSRYYLKNIEQMMDNRKETSYVSKEADVDWSKVRPMKSFDE